jgi:very-short-patch-repair endonuclease
LACLKELPIDGTHFRRQAPIGPYVVDFFCPAKRLILELDGGHHSEDATAKRDSERQAWLEQEGYRVIRFWNSDVTSDLRAVMEKIYVEVYGSREAEPAPLKHTDDDNVFAASLGHLRHRRALMLPWRGRIGSHEMRTEVG